MRAIEKLLIANRGEIAVRIVRTCREMGIATVAVFSDADAGALHVRMADEAVRIGPAPAVQSYLDMDAVLAAAASTGADAVHPGYGFLAENAAFAAACVARGLTFVGPGPEVIGRLGSKREARRLAAAAGVPVVPGYDGDAQDPQALLAQARQLGFPLLIKASAGGGGKGMRVVRDGDEAELLATLESARREARSASGDDTLLIERYIERPRHVEIQILGDTHGNLVHLFERECSIQRRYQKVIEESPAPALTPALRERMSQAAVAVGRAVGYVSAGTVELIVDERGEFYFLEVNTRLQVEHPVTELVTGLDLVREQIRIAQGEAIDVRGLEPRGAAIECRLYAEDPEHGYLPTTGRIVDWHVPALAGLRVDSGIEAGSEVGIHYDPMLAKVICHAPTRGEAIRKLMYALRRLSVLGVVTNRELVLRVLGHPAFQAGHVDTHFLATHAAELVASRLQPEHAAEAALVAALAAHEQRRRQQPLVPGLEPGYRNNRFTDEHVEYRLLEAGAGEVTAVVSYRNQGNRRFHASTRVHRAGEPEWRGPARVVQIIELSVAPAGPVAPAPVVLSVEDERGLRRVFRVSGPHGDQAPAAQAPRPGARWFVHGIAGSLGLSVGLSEQPRFAMASAQAHPGGCMAPMPGKVVTVLVRAGQAVGAGDALVVLEAMKMEHTVRAPADGVVMHVLVSTDEQVSARQLLVELASTPANPAE